MKRRRELLSARKDYTIKKYRLFFFKYSAFTMRNCWNFLAVAACGLPVGDDQVVVLRLSEKDLPAGGGHLVENHPVALLIPPKVELDNAVRCCLPQIN